jgi:hypothetical protein
VLPSIILPLNIIASGFNIFAISTNLHPIYPATSRKLFLTKRSPLLDAQITSWIFNLDGSPSQASIISLKTPLLIPSLHL